MITFVKYLKKNVTQEKIKICVITPEYSIQGNGFKLQEGRFQMNLTVKDV